LAPHHASFTASTNFAHFVLDRIPPLAHGAVYRFGLSWRDVSLDDLGHQSGLKSCNILKRHLHELSAPQDRHFARRSLGLRIRGNHAAWQEICVSHPRREYPLASAGRNAMLPKMHSAAPSLSLLWHKNDPAQPQRGNIAGAFVSPRLHICRGIDRPGLNSDRGVM
jgi:hypothetical protein